MPIYEYRCEDCGHQTEFMQKISDPPATDCPRCEQPALKKLISTVAFRFKGGGWYETDFKTGDKKNLAAGDNDKPADKKTADGAETKNGQRADSVNSTADSAKPAEKKETKSKAPATSSGTSGKAA